MSAPEKDITNTKTADGDSQRQGSVTKGTVYGDNIDDVVLRANGHEAVLRRQFNWLSGLGLGFSITNSWVGYLVSLVLNPERSRALILSSYRAALDSL